VSPHSYQPVAMEMSQCASAQQSAISFQPTTIS
jgi:hypothetical protein